MLGLIFAIEALDNVRRRRGAGIPRFCKPHASWGCSAQALTGEFVMSIAGDALRQKLTRCFHTARRLGLTPWVVNPLTATAAPFW
jgi:hypothetical protein